MGINTDAVQRLYVAYFNRPADPAGLDAFEKLLSSTVAATQAQLEAVAVNFRTSTEYANLYAGMSNAAIVNAMYNNLFGRDCESVTVLNTWTNWIADGTYTFEKLALQLTYSAQGTDATVIANKLASANTFTTNINTVAEVIGYSGDAAAASARTWLATVTSTTASVTAAAGTVDTTIAAIVTGTAATTGQTYTLTTGIDQGAAFTGGSGNDIFIGDAGSAGLADTLVGGLGADILKLYGNAAEVNHSGIETIYLNGNTAGFDVSDNADVTLLELVDPTTGQVYTTTTGQAIKLSTMVAGEAITFAGNTPTSLALTTNSVSATGADVTVNLTGTKVASLALTNETAKSQITLTNAGAALTSITVAASAALELGHALTTIKTINASASTATVDIDAVGASDLTFTGGSGNDRINLAATLTAADTIAGGTGTDTLAISDADTLTTLTAAKVTGFEILEATTADGTAYDVDAIITNNTLTGVLVSATGGAATTVSNINTGAANNIKFTGDTPTAITLTVKDMLSGGTTDAATVILDNSVNDNADGVDIATSLTFTLVDKLTVQATSDATDAARAIVNSIAGLTATDLDTMVVTGNAAVSITTAAATASLGEVDASASTGAVTLVTTASALTNVIYRGNAEVDTVTINNAATNTATIFSGGGSDVFELGVTGAAHAFTFTATDFTTGDVKAGDAITINLLSAFQAADVVTFNFGTAIEGLLKVGGIALSSLTADSVLVGAAFSSTTNVRAVDGGNNTTLQFDLDGDGVFTAAADFSIEILGLANNTLNYTAATDLFTFTATA